MEPCNCILTESNWRIEMTALLESKQSNLFETPFSEVDRTVLRNGIRFYSIGCTSIPAPIVSRYFTYYNLLYWSGSHLLKQIQAGIIERDNIAFRVIFHKLSRGKILANPDKQYKLSFRHGLMNDPIVLIS